MKQVVLVELENFLECYAKFIECYEAIVLNIYSIKEPFDVVFGEFSTQAIRQLQEKLFGLAHGQASVVRAIGLRENLANYVEYVRIVRLDRRRGIRAVDDARQFKIISRH